MARSAFFVFVVGCILGRIGSAQNAIPNYAVNQFTGSFIPTINAITTSSDGSVYIAGSTPASDLPILNATQPVVGEGLVIRSTDLGKTWQKLASPPSTAPGDPIYITAHPSDPQVIFYTTRVGIYRTTDAGASWNLVLRTGSIVGPDQIPYVVAIDPGNPNLVYAASFPGRGDSRFASSTDGGTTWISSSSLGGVITPGSGFNLKSLWVDPFGSGLIGAAGYLSRDHGATWTHPIAANFFVPDPRHRGWIYGIGSSQIRISTDYGTTWNALGTTLPFHLVRFVVDPDQDRKFYGIDLNGLTKTTSDNGASWQTGAPADAPLVAESRTCANGGGLVSSSGFSSDFGQTWQPMLAPVQDLATGPQCTLYMARSMTSDAFVAKFAPGGSKLLWATYLGGLLRDSATQITVDSKGYVYVAGTTRSPDFPVTTGTPRVAGSDLHPFAASFDPNGGLVYAAMAAEAGANIAGIAVNKRGEVNLAVDQSTAIKFDATGGLLYSITLPTAGGTFSVAAEASGSTLYGTSMQGKLYRVSADGSTVEVAVEGGLGAGISQMDTGLDGSIYVAAFQSPPSANRSSTCQFTGDGLTILKLASGTLAPIYATRFDATCLTAAQTFKVNPDGQVAMAFITYGEVPLVNPVIATPQTGLPAYNGAALFDTQGELVFSTYLGVGQIVAAAGAMYVAVSGGFLQMLPVPAMSNVDIQITGLYDAFSGLSGRPVAPGELVTITGANLAPDWSDLGLNDGQALPLVLDGVQVMVNSIPAPILQVAPDHIIFAIPPEVNSPYAVIQVTNTAAPRPSQSTVVNATTSLPPSLLTRQFPALPSGPADGNVRNADGLLNDASHPARKGDLVTMYANGVVGAAGNAVSLSWDFTPAPGYAYSMRGFIPSIYAIDLIVPASSSSGKVFVTGNQPSGIYIYVK